MAVHNTDINGQTVKCSWGKESGDPNNAQQTGQVNVRSFIRTLSEEGESGEIGDWRAGQRFSDRISFLSFDSIRENPTSKISREEKKRKKRTPTARVQEESGRAERI